MEWNITIPRSQKVYFLRLSSEVVEYSCLERIRSAISAEYGVTVFNALIPVLDKGIMKSKADDTGWNSIKGHYQGDNRLP